MGEQPDRELPAPMSIPRPSGLRAVAAAEAVHLTIARIDEPAEAFFISSSVCDQGRTERCCQRERIRPH